ncbi:6-carboxytetrahydropterin synthase [Glaciecola petra]|uniref:6-carboxy-5,6,7,8-tetrahydropterin synthase n=1 Tax=Glaciecola petra TaxID=3075602 RepID=A0ABU2ZQ12_9ALTE|nr:6-carboxytetrahydropterin synthase [Aestuariibacter sp. P117]MDT0594429.1 6-carboxytetrahydropterin synthase [Aestuariibacter sp. P117]
MQLFVNDLTVMDFSYLCPRRGMVGESWIVDVILDGGLNDESMVQDFGIVKKQLKRIIDDYVDHKLVVPAENTKANIHHPQSDERVQVDFLFDEDKWIQLNCPPEAYAFVYSETVNKKSVTHYLKDVIATHLPENVHDIEINLREEIINSPYYHYTHGLKKHEGNCQRIAHGHRSKILISEDAENAEWLQTYWAKRWQDIYIGSNEDIVDANTLSFEVKQFTSANCFQYESSQGIFEMAIDKSACELIDYDSTVECLAQYVLEESRKKSNKRLKVMAFEGVGKGAMCGD